MIYRIFFQPKGAYWCIQFKSFLFWVSVQGGVRGKDDLEVGLQVLKFDTLADAEKYCTDRGIDAAYHRTQTTSYMTAILSGAKTAQQEEDQRSVLVHRDCSGPSKSINLTVSDPARHP